MVKLINYIFGKGIFQISKGILYLSPDIKYKFTTIKNSIQKFNYNNELPGNLIKSIIQIEDKRFFEHYGIDLYSIFRAIYKNTTTNRIEGASTIVQQLVRNILNDRKIEFKRKLVEIILASLIDNEFCKKEILTTYLNTYKFDNDIGIISLCKTYSYDLNQLTIYESAQIAARLKYPKISKINYIRYLKRVRIIELKNIA